MNNYMVDRKKWSKMSIVEQMGNIASEVGRSINAKKNGDEERMNGAIIRALDLFDATTEDLVAKKPYRLREVLRAKDQFLSLFFDNNFNDADALERYFMQYAIAARR